MTEQTLPKSEEYRTLVEHFPKGAIGLFDRDLRYTAVGGELITTVGISPEDRIGNRITEIYPEEIVAEVEPHFKATFEGKQNSFEAEFHDRHLSAQTFPIKDNKGEVVAGMLVVQDITDRREAQQALRESEKNYRTLFETMDEGFCILKLQLDDNDEVVDFRYVEVNPAFKKHAGLENIKGKRGSEVLPDSGKDWLKVYSKVALTGESKHFEYYSEELGRWFEISAFRVGEPSERTVAGLFNNITERKRAQEHLKVVNEILEEKVEKRTKSLRAYQNQLRSLVFELSRTEEQERQRLATDLHDNLSQMLAMGKMKVQQVQQENPPDNIAGDLIDLEELIKEALIYTRELTSELKPPSSLGDEDLRAHIDWVAETMEKHGLKVKIKDDERLKPLNEEVQMTILQCVRELLFNVIKHASVEEAVVDLKRDEDLLKVIVKDGGEGFDSKTKEMQSNRKGGFGLFSIRERINLLDGKMNIESETGEGTSIHLSVPLEDGDPVDSFCSEESRDSKSDTIKILLADNHQMVREGLRNIINKEPDMEVVGEASDGEEVINMASNCSPDVVLMEPNIPKINSIEAIQSMLSEDPNIRIIGLSEQNKEKEKEIREAGASAYLNKKESFKSLASSIRTEALARQYLAPIRKSHS